MVNQFSIKASVINTLLMLFISLNAGAQQQVKIKKKDRKRDVEMTTTKGVIVVRLSDSTPLHRENFLKLVKSDFYDSVTFHRVIEHFMIQAGDPNTKRLVAGKTPGEGGPGYTVPAEIRPGLFHKKGVIAAARTSDEVNPERVSSGSQFYLVQGKVFTDAGLDSVETFRLKGKKKFLRLIGRYTRLLAERHILTRITPYSGKLFPGLKLLILLHRFQLPDLPAATGQ